MSTILITGGTGMVGRALGSYLISKGHSIIILTRNASGKKTEQGIEYAVWDVQKQEIDIAAVQKADHIIHLAGASVFDKRWTTAYKKEIEESRTKSSELIARTLKEHPHSVKTVVSSSAVGWYGPDKIPGHAFTEAEPAATDFLGNTCRLWEQSIQPVQEAVSRLVIIRIGIVLSNAGGFLAPIQKGLKFGIAAITGDGKQTVSWIHIDDLCRIFLFAIENNNMNGPFNAVAPHPVNMKELVLKEAALLKGKFYLPFHVPAFLLKIILGERSIETLKSATVSCTHIKKEGFNFMYPAIDAALPALRKSLKDPI